MPDDATNALGVELRGYRRTDLEAMFRLDETCFAAAFRFDRTSMRRFAEAGAALTVVAVKSDEAADRVVGFVIVHLERRERAGYVVTLDVDPEFRRSGLAGRMMDDVEARAGLARAVRMELDVFAENEAAIRFYEGRGYVRLGVRPDFYGAGMDALAYSKELG
jgi:ribosomal-protein-alanine N-acetyltransferase